MDMVATLIPNLIATDLVSVQAVENRVGMINILEYQYGSDKGAAKDGQVIASPLAYQGMNPEYSSAAVTETWETGQDRLKWVPVLTNTVHVYDDQNEEQDVKFNADGTIITTGAGEVTAMQPDWRVTYLYDNETVPVNAPQLKLGIRSLPIETKSRKLAAIWSFDAQYELTKELTYKVA